MYEYNRPMFDIFCEYHESTSKYPLRKLIYIRFLNLYTKCIEYKMLVSIMAACCTLANSNVLDIAVQGYFCNI